MSVKIIAEDILEESHFLSATEQEGEFWDQPEPDNGNDGLFRLLSKSTPEDFSYSGTTTANGAPDGTTVIDTALKIFGADYFIDGTVAITSGACNGESKSITDFSHATGQAVITTVAFSAQIVGGVTFTLTVAFASRDFRIELIASGEAGDATFKWSHDGGTIWYGREKLYQADWPRGLTAISQALFASSKVGMIQAENDDLIIGYTKPSPLAICCKISSDRGITWGSEIIIKSGYKFCAFCKLSSGRIWCFQTADNRRHYSDDNGATWAMITDNRDAHDGIELYDGSLGIVIDTGIIVFEKSTDNGISLHSRVIIANDANTQKEPAICQLPNGDIICAYTSDEDSVGVWEIKCKISTDGGATWGSVIEVMAASPDKDKPDLIVDIDGKVYCTAHGTGLYLTYSADGGATWESIITLHNLYGYDKTGSFAMINNHHVICIDNYNDTLIMFPRRGIWETYASNACPCAVKAKEQKLICDAGIVWHGGSGVVGDKWNFEAGYYFSMKNIISGSPSKTLRSEQDNIAYSLIIDMGANVRHQADSVAFFGCNLRTLSFQMNATDSWGSPSVDESISFDMAVGEIDAVAGNYIQDALLLALYKDHELKGKYFRATSGTDNGKTWEIKDNVGDYIVLDTTTAHNLAATDIFAIFQKHISKIFTGGIYRYIRIYITAQETVEGYYQIGEALIGKATELSLGYETGFKLVRNQNISILTTPKGGTIAIPKGDARNAFQLTWKATEATRLEILALIDYLHGKNFVLIPDSTDPKDCSLLKITESINQIHRYMDRYDISVKADEVK